MGVGAVLGMVMVVWRVEVEYCVTVFVYVLVVPACVDVVLVVIVRVVVAVMVVGWVVEIVVLTTAVWAWFTLEVDDTAWASRLQAEVTTAAGNVASPAGVLMLDVPAFWRASSSRFLFSRVPCVVVAMKLYEVIVIVVDPG